MSKTVILNEEDRLVVVDTVRIMHTRHIRAMLAIMEAVSEVDIATYHRQPAKTQLQFTPYGHTSRAERRNQRYEPLPKPSKYLNRK